jgi:hypothetical protein
LSRESEVDVATISALIQRDSRRTEYLPELAKALAVEDAWLSKSARRKGHQNMGNASHGTVIMKDIDEIRRENMFILEKEAGARRLLLLTLAGLNLNGQI